jgi:hypothetical protein
VLRIGQQSDDLAALYQKYTVSTAAVLTAWNPSSELRPSAENEIAQAELVSEIDRLALLHRSAQGTDPTGKWPSEQSRLVLGLDLETANVLAHQFGQNGIVWVGADTVPTLLLMC